MLSFAALFRLRYVAPAVVAFVLAGCAVPFPAYTVSSSNIATIRAADRPIELGHFAGDQTFVYCHDFTFTPEGGKTFAQYIRAAFADELVIAGNTSTKPKVLLSARLSRIAVVCRGWEGRKWEIDLEVTLPDQPPFTVNTVHKFANLVFEPASQATAYHAFLPSVQETVANVLAHPNVRRAQAQ